MEPSYIFCELFMKVLSLTHDRSSILYIRTFSHPLLSLSLPSSSHCTLCYTNTPEAAYIRCRGGTVRGLCASHLLLLLLLLLQGSSLQPVHTHCDGDSPPGRPFCIPSISTAFFVQPSACSWGCAPVTEWT